MLRSRPKQFCERCSRNMTGKDYGRVGVCRSCRENGLGRPSGEYKGIQRPLGWRQRN